MDLPGGACDSCPLCLCLQTSLSIFNRDEVSVKRRFSDFLGLHSKLASKYLHIGYIVPPAPEKSIVGKCGMPRADDRRRDVMRVEFMCVFQE